MYYKHINKLAKFKFKVQKRKSSSQSDVKKNKNSAKVFWYKSRNVKRNKKIYN